MPTANVDRVDRVTLARYALPGLLGTALMALGSLGVGWLPASSALLDWAIVGTLRTTSGGEVFSRVAVLTGVALLLQAWLVLGHDVLDGLERGERRLAGILAIWIVPLLLMPPLFSRDAYSYFAQGQLVQSGLNPYETGVSALPGWFLTGADPLWAESPGALRAGVPAAAGRCRGARRLARLRRGGAVPAAGDRRRRADGGLPAAARLRARDRPGQGAVARRAQPAGADALRGRRAQRRAHGRPDDRRARAWRWSGIRSPARC